MSHTDVLIVAHKPETAQMKLTNKLSKNYKVSVLR